MFRENQGFLVKKLKFSVFEISNDTSCLDLFGLICTYTNQGECRKKSYVILWSIEAAEENSLY